MKSILTLALAACLLSCAKDPAISELPGTHLANLHLQNSRNFIPVNTLHTNTRAVFINTHGDVKQLDITLTEGVTYQQYQHFGYNTEYIKVTYTDRTDETYVPQILAQGQYNALEEITESLAITVNTDVNHNFIPTLILCPAADCAYLENYYETIDIAGLSFHRVYANWTSPPQFDSFTKVFYTIDQGIVGFEGYDGEMWALSRFE